MTAIQKYLSDLTDEEKTFFDPVYGSVERFYRVVYLIVRNEHLTDLDKPERYEDRLQMIRSVKKAVQKQLDSWGLDGKEITADISSDYFEDYVNYRNPDLDITNEEFVDIIKKVMK